jgi:glutamine synthetase
MKKNSSKSKTKDIVPGKAGTAKKAVRKVLPAKDDKTISAPRKPNSATEREESHLKRWLREHRITEVECLVPDITGNARGKIIPAAKFSTDYGTRLPEGIFATTVTGEYIDEYDEIVSPSDSDMYLRPDPNTLRVVPWASDPTVQIIHDCFTKDGKPHNLNATMRSA